VSRTSYHRGCFPNPENLQPMGPSCRVS
jgi:hypothetical protein